MHIPESEILEIKLVALDFDGVFTDNNVIVDENGKESVVCSRADGIGLSLLKQRGFQIYIVSSEHNPVVKQRAKKLDINCLQGIREKDKALEDLCKLHNIQMKNILFLGNDINDIPAFKCAGLAIGVDDSHPNTYEYLNFRLSKKGGDAAVRELCDLILDTIDDKKYF